MIGPTAPDREGCRSGCRFGPISGQARRTTRRRPENQGGDTMRGLETVISIAVGLFPYAVLLGGLLLLWSIAGSLKRISRDLERLVSRKDLELGRLENLRERKPAPLDS